MTKEEAAAQLDGNQYGKEGSSALWAAMRAAGLVAAFGASDDLLEFRGAIDDEVGAYGGHDQPVLPTGLPKNECEDDGCPYFEKTLKGAASVEAEWHDQGDGPCWVIKSAVPHATFSVFEDGEPYCRGIVFALADVPAPAAAKPDTTDPLYALCRAFIEKHRISCLEATAEDRVYEHAPELVEEIAKVVGFYRYPDEEAA